MELHYLYLSEATCFLPLVSGFTCGLNEAGSFHLSVGDIALVKTIVKNLYFRIRTILYVCLTL